MAVAQLAAYARMQDEDLMKRSVVCIARHAYYLKNLEAGGSLSQAQKDWFVAALRDPTVVYHRLKYELVSTDAVGNADTVAAIADADLQAVIDGICERY
jgi:hypothetical protein